jgi:hypothetical protein
MEEKFVINYKVWNCDTEYKLMPFYGSPKEAWDGLFKTLRRAGNRIDMLQKVEILKVVE